MLAPTDHAVRSRGRPLGSRVPAATPLALLLSLLLVACDGATTGPPADEPSPDATPHQVQRDVEALIGGSMAGWWRASHGPEPGAALSTAADAHTSSWRNWGMLDAGAEPRQPPNTDPEYRFQFITAPWTELYRTLVSVRDGLAAIEEGAEIGEGGADTDRAVAFGKFMQGMALGQLAVLFDAAFIVDESTDVETVTRSPYPQVLEAALTKLDEAIEIAETGAFTVPSEWLAFGNPMDQDGFARLARSFRARYRMEVARSPGERAAVDWAAVLPDAESGITQTFAGYYDGDWENNWAWSMDKLLAGAAHPIWGRLDYRTIGPADASGAWEAWIAAPPSSREPFRIDTDDRRITGGSPTTDGSYGRYAEDIRFRPSRGVDHFSYYWDGRWAHLMEAFGVGDQPDFPVEELDFIRAEALYRLGDRGAAMEVVNASRENGGLPPFLDPAGVAPGGDRCVPQLPDGSCGDLFEALKYEKRVELFHYGPFIEYLDDRGWGDLVTGTFVELPAPAGGFEELLDELYGEADAGGSVELANDSSADAIHAKREAFGDFDRERNSNPGDVGAG